MKEKWKIVDFGFDYHIVAVFGSQSTGKSTLLNGLFGTNFDVMDEKSRKQTTKGIWVGSAQGKSNVLVMDVEGTDGRERGEDQDFERKSALFSLAVSQVLIINMWEHAVGLYNGANMGLLKTVMDVHLQLFHQKGSAKTLLLFVIRDHVGKTPLANLSETLIQDLHKIWDSLSKPEDSSNVTIDQCFDFKFFALPHKLLMEDKFKEQTGILSHWFTDSSSSDYVFKSEYQKSIPADGFSTFAGAIWEKIISNRDLDLPTQQELLAQYRCDEILSEVFSVFSSAVKEVHRELQDSKVVDNFGKKVSDPRHAAIKGFEEVAHRYKENVFNKKRSDLIEKIDEHLAGLFATQQKNLYKLASSTFESIFETGLENGDKGFMQVVKEAQSEAMTLFNRYSEGSIIPELKEQYNFVDLKKELEADLAKTIRSKRAEHIRSTIQSLRRTTANKISDIVISNLEEATGPELWTSMFSSYGHVYESLKKILNKKLHDFECTDKENLDNEKAFKVTVWETFLEVLKLELSDSNIVPKLRKKFESDFRYGPDGLPKVWQPTDDIDAAYRKAKDLAESFIPLYGKIQLTVSASQYLPFKYRLKEEEADASATSLTQSSDNLFVFEDETLSDQLRLISESHQKQIAVQLHRECDLVYLDAKRSLVSGSTSVPPYMLLLLLLLGWNEIVAVLSSPLLLFCLVFVGGGLFLAHQLQILGPWEGIAWAFVQRIFAVLGMITTNLISAGVSITNEAINGGGVSAGVSSNPSAASTSSS